MTRASRFRLRSENSFSGITRRRFVVHQRKAFGEPFRLGPVLPWSDVQRRTKLPVRNTFFSDRVLCSEFVPRLIFVCRQAYPLHVFHRFSF